MRPAGRRPTAPRHQRQLPRCSTGSGASGERGCRLEAAAEPAGTAVLSTSPSPADQKVWANYDFVPGQRTIFYTDFTEDQVGNFPERLDFKTGQMEVVEFEGGKRALKASSESQFVIPLPEVLPEKYTIEVDVINRNSQGTAANTIELAGGSEGFKDDKGIHVGWGHNGLETRGGGMENQWIGSKDEDKAKYVGHPASFRLLGDGKYLKIYADEKRLANFPKATLTRDKAVSVRLQGRDDDKEAVYITRIRVAESEKSIYDALSSKGSLEHPGNSLRYREVRDQAGIDSDPEADRGRSQGASRSQGGSSGPHRQRRQSRG